MTIDEPAADTAALDARIAAAVAEFHRAGGLEIAVDPLSYRREIEAALEPVLHALHSVAADGVPIDLDDLYGELGLLPGKAVESIRPWIERAVEDGAAKREVLSGVLLISDKIMKAAACRAEWCRWEAFVKDDLTGPALELDILTVARHAMRHWLATDPVCPVPAEAAYATIAGFRAAGLPISRGAWGYALDGANAGRSDFLRGQEVEADRLRLLGDAVAKALAGATE